MSNDKPKNIIGVFDSGLGGLTVLKYFLKNLSNYNYLYLGDTARLPYGSKTPETIYKYTKEGVDFLFNQGCNLVIIACNTASAQALPRLQQEYLINNYPNRRILGIIRPLVDFAGQNKKNKKIGVLGTNSTINSNAYKNELKKINPQLQVFQQSAPLLVPLIEEGWINKPETKMILKKYLRPLKEKRIDTLILACTHYPFLFQDIKRIMGRQVEILQPGEIISLSLENYLLRHPELGLKTVKMSDAKYFVTDSPKKFKLSAENFLEQSLNKLIKINLPTSQL